MNWTELTGYIEGTNTQQGVLVNKTSDKMFFRLQTGAVRPGFNSKSLAADDDRNSSGPEPIGFLANVFPTNQNPGPWNNCYVNNNGNVTIGNYTYEYTPLPLQSAAAIVPGLVGMFAPFWADVDTLPASNPATSNGCKVVTYGQGFVDGQKAFGVNWVNVGYYDTYGGATDKLNSFQMVLIDRSNEGVLGDFDAEFNYNQMLWETGEASDGANGYGGMPARVGITNGIDRTVEARYSGESLVQLDANPITDLLNYTTGLIYRKRNSTVPGRQVFQFRSGSLRGALQVNAGPDQNLSSEISDTVLQGTASDPLETAVSVEWSVMKTSGSTPVIFANADQLNTAVSFGAGDRVDLVLKVKRLSDPTASASDVMIINPEN